MTGLFIFAVGPVNTTYVYFMVATQVFPEFVGDYIITYIENWLGFDKIFEKYIDHNTGTVPTSPHSADQIGNVTKTFWLKITFSYMAASFIMVVILKNQEAYIIGGGEEGG